MTNPNPIETDGRDRLTRVDVGVYSLEAVLKSAYRFTGRCFIHIAHADDNALLVRMRPKDPNENPDSSLRDFLNDLLDQRLRSIIEAETAQTRDLIMAHALSKTPLIRPEFESDTPQQILSDARNRASVSRTPA